MLKDLTFILGLGVFSLNSQESKSPLPKPEEHYIYSRPSIVCIREEELNPSSYAPKYREIPKQLRKNYISKHPFQI